MFFSDVVDVVFDVGKPDLGRIVLGGQLVEFVLESVQLGVRLIERLLLEGQLLPEGGPSAEAKRGRAARKTSARAATNTGGTHPQIRLVRTCGVSKWPIRSLYFSRRATALPAGLRGWLAGYDPRSGRTEFPQADLSVA